MSLGRKNYLTGCSAAALSRTLWQLFTCFAGNKDCKSYFCFAEASSPLPKELSLAVPQMGVHVGTAETVMHRKYNKYIYIKIEEAHVFFQ